jgi:predicted methyltransferase
VLWLRELNPWSPRVEGAFTLTLGDVAEEIVSLPDSSFDAALHDPPRFGIAGELYSQAFYDQLARLLKRRGVLFHYTGTPNKLTTGRDVPNEVSNRLRRAGFTTEIVGDGVLAKKRM